MTAGYTSDGLRSWKADSGRTRTYFVYDGDTPVVELTTSGASTTVAAVNTFGPIGLVERETPTNGAATFYQFDPQGNVAHRLNASTGAVLSSDLYEAYGSQVNGSALDPFAWEGQAGYYRDSETGLYLLTHRYYDPMTGRFLNRDPIGLDGGIGLYAYVGGNPVNATDPSGLRPVTGTEQNWLRKLYAAKIQADIRRWTSTSSP